MNAETEDQVVPEPPWMKPVERGFVIVVRHPDGREYMLEQFGIFWCDCEKCLIRIAETCSAVTEQTGYPSAAVCLERTHDAVNAEIAPGSRH